METRRSARIPARFWVGVEGVDDCLRQREGDISATGMYFEVQAPLGDVGTVQWLHLSSLDRKHRLEVMAHVVRVMSFADIRRGAVTGVALEFMPENDESTRAVHDFVRHVLTLRLQEDLALQVTHEIAASVESERESDDKLTATVRQLSVHGLLLDTNWPMTVGDTVTIEIHAPAARRPIKIRGQAVRVLSGNDDATPHYRIELQVRGDSLQPSPTSVSNLYGDRGSYGPSSARASLRPGAIESLFADLVAPSATSPQKKEHLSGQLARIRLPTLVSLFEMERMTGELYLTRGAEKTRVFIRDGRIVDIEDEGSATIPRERVNALLRWKEGTFDFNVGPVDREDRLGVSTIALILDVAREEDESRHEMQMEGGSAADPSG